MATIAQDLDCFRRFVEEKLKAGCADASLDELFDLWRQENPSADQVAEDVAAIAASIEDFQRGERGAIAGIGDLMALLADEPELADQIMDDVYRTRELQPLRTPQNRSHDS